MAARTISLDTLVRRIDPDYDRNKRREPEYIMSNGRVFDANRDTRHPYDIEVEE